MCMLKLAQLMAIVPIAVLLMASFFVLFTLQKIEKKELRVFGYVVVSFLWLAAAVVFLDAVYKTAQRSVSMREMMQPRMKMEYMPPIMQSNNVSGLVMPERSPLAKDQKPSGCSKCQGNKGVIFKTE
jgi:hypothetical protein